MHNLWTSRKKLSAMIHLFGFVLLGVCVDGYIFCNETNFTLATNPYIRHFSFPKCPPRSSAPRFQLYTRNTSDIGEDISFDSLPPSYLVSKPLYLVIHGFKSAGKTSWITEMKDAFLEKEVANIVIVDWSVIASKDPYEQTAYLTPYVGSHISKLVQKIKTDKGNETYVWCIGHSLGAHVCHYASYKLTPVFNRISGLDPAGPVFYLLNLKAGLNPSSAQFVDVIHTSGLFGTRRQLGHADFYPNGGTNQPGCYTPECMHAMAYIFFLESIKKNCYEYPLLCDLDPSSGEYDFENHCEWCFECSPMGYKATKPANSTVFYLRTRPEPPYCSIWAE